MVSLALLAALLGGRPAVTAPLADAAERADWSGVRELLAGRADVSAAQPDGMTALHWAAHHAHLDAAKRLIAAGASAKAANRYGVTPLSLACTAGDEPLVRTLLAAGADANAPLRGGETPLMTAARTGRAGAVRALLAAGAKPDAADRKGQTALMWAAAEGHTGAVEVLLAAGADVNARVPSGFTPLLFAARDGKLSVVRALLAAGADPNQAIRTEKRVGGFGAKDGTSALALAVENAHFELALALVTAGADPNDQRAGFTPLHTLTWVRKPSRGDDPDGLPPPAGSGAVTSLEFARKLVAAGADANSRLKNGGSRQARPGSTPFLMACKTADLPYLKLLVELGADPKLSNAAGCTPLMVAAGVGTHAPTEEAGTEPEVVETVNYLLGLGADVNATDANGETAMHGAAYKSLPAVVQLLAAKGAKVEVWNRKNKSGWTPLLIAEGFRPGNFKPSAETIEAIHRVMRAAGVTPPPPTPRPSHNPPGYDVPIPDG